MLSGFGLSAFIYSTLSHALFPGQTASYLLLLAFGSSCSFLLGVALIRIIPPEEEVRKRRRASDGRGSYGQLETSPQSDDVEGDAAVRRPLGRRRTSSDVTGRAWTHTPLADDETPSTSELSDEEEAVRTPAALRQTRSRAASSSSAHTHETAKDAAGVRNITGWKLFTQLDFGLLFVIMTFISGIGLLVINVRVRAANECCARGELSLPFAEHRHDHAHALRVQQAAPGGVTDIACHGRRLTGCGPARAKTAQYGGRPQCSDRCRGDAHCPQG